MSTSSNNGKAIKTVDDAFKWFERNVARVPDDENADRKSVHPEVRKSVSDALDVEHHFLSGSYGRKTQAKKLKDVDIIVVLKDEDGGFYSSASDALEKVRNAAGRMQPRTAHPRLGPRRQVLPRGLRVPRGRRAGAQARLRRGPSTWPATSRTRTSTTGPWSTPSSS